MNNNKLIAEFMGLEFSKGEYYRPLYNSGDWIPENELEYNKSWDWLMPVIHTIRDHVNMDMGFEEFDDWRENFKQIDPYNYNLEQCYEAVVEFIKEYNKYICGSCGDHVNEVVFNEDTDVDECKNCT